MADEHGQIFLMAYSSNESYYGIRLLRMAIDILFHIHSIQNRT